MAINNFKLIEAEQALNNLEILSKDTCIYSDTYKKLTYEQQKKIYEYCLLHCTSPIAKENLKQIRYAVAKIYFNL